MRQANEKKVFAGAATPREKVIIFVHFPLSNHRFAMPGARAAECAAEQDRFNALVSTVYSKQDSLGLKSWISFAREAGVGDTIQFGQCAASSTPSTRIEKGLELGGRVGVMGTPTVIINGWVFSRPPEPGQLSRIVDRIRNGKSPI